MYRSVENIADFLRERGRREWLLQERDAFFEHTVFSEDIVSVAGHEQDTRVRMPRGDAAREVRALADRTSVG